MKKILFLFVMLCCMIISCGNNTDSKKDVDSSDSKDGIVMRIGVLPTLDALPFFIAKERGFFEREKIGIRLIQFNAHMDIDTALVGGSIDAAFTDLIRTERLMNNYGMKLHYLTTTELYWTLVSNKVARINRLDQFGDKMVAMTRWSATDYFTNKTFDKVKTKAMVYGVQINDIDVRLRMILNNEMDGAWLPEPQATVAINKGNKNLLSTRKYKEKLGVLALRTQNKENKKIENELRKIYSEACDSINKYGIKSYSREISKYCHVSNDIVKTLPDYTYIHAERPLANSINTAKDFKRR
jgi:NitT/TauT family transport system substrate-binding protein